MEEKLKKMFDYQAFENEPNLANTIDSATKAGETISLDDLDMVAGGIKVLGIDDIIPEAKGFIEEGKIPTNGIQSVKRTP